MKAAEIREKFLAFFESKGHKRVPSSSLIPSNDPTLLFTNSGMVQFKDVFTGKDQRPFSRATTSQRCVRAGGKHNDLENVGYTARHHTFFEMLGNFSFGDYFKQEAIQYAWELLTTVFKLPPERLYVTVYQEDDQAYNLWHQVVGVPVHRIIRIGDNKGARYASDNFWQMADTGPCGPCTEIFYDHGPEVAGGLPGSPNEDGDRYIEIWNLVFMQFDRSADGTLTPLPKPCVDTGMGLERVAAVLQHVHSNYEIDLFATLIRQAKQVIDQTVGSVKTVPIEHSSLKVIADHIRACAFMIADGVIPGNEGRGYVLRRIIRRAIRHGYKLGCRKPFFHTLLHVLCQEMGQAYPALTQPVIASILHTEEERFFETIEQGMVILEEALADLQPHQQLAGDVAFKLHDTYGFPLDLTADVCRERHISVDEAAFDQAMSEQKNRARAAGKFTAHQQLNYAGDKTQFKGYEQLQLSQAKVLALYVEGCAVNSIAAGQIAVVVLDQTSFYAESGGQVGDQGVLQCGTHVFQVADTQTIAHQVVGHYGQLRTGQLAQGELVTPQVNENYRLNIMRNHSATHLMHKALRQVLGGHVSQKGSLVDADKTRFDFAHHSAMTAEEIQAVETQVNAEILANHLTQARVMAIDEAKASGAMMLFGEKYGDTVRVLDIGSSRELCGGTHVQRTGDIGLFKILSETGIAAGVRRIEAITGLGVLKWLQTSQAQLQVLAGLLKCAPADLSLKTQALLDHQKVLDKQIGGLKSQLATNQGHTLVSQAIHVQGVQVLAVEVQGVDVPQLREMAEQVRNQLERGAVVLAVVHDTKVNLVAAVSSSINAHIQAGQLVNFVAQQVGGKGGGRPDIAQAGGNQPENLKKALASVIQWAKDQLSQ